MTIKNGRIPASQLVVVANGKKLRKGAPANSFKRMSDRSHAKGYGHIGLADGYRDIAGQDRAWAAYKAGTGNLAAWPGTSNHGLGISGDLLEPYATTGPKHSWLEARAAFYGWYWEGKAFHPIETWHWTFKGFPARPILRRGAEGDAVTAWQCVLRYDLHLSASVLHMDGIFGPVAERYTKQWQKAHKLTTDGIPGPKTWKAAGLA